MAVAGRLPVRLRTTFLAAVATAVAGRLAALHRAAVAAARQCIADAARGQGQGRP